MDSEPLISWRGSSLLIDDAARVLGVSRRTVYYRIREGKLQTIRAKCGSQRVLTASIVALLEERRKKSESQPLPLQIEPLA
jgi:excisionase family DNA binding protein